MTDKFYYVKKKNGDVCIRQSQKAVPFVDFEEVLAPVPSYQELQELKEYEKTIKSYNGMPIDYTIACETVNKLLDEKDVLKKKNARLKELLKECLPIVSAEIMSWQIRGGEESHQRGKELLTKINEVLR